MHQKILNFEFENFGRYNPRWTFASPPGQCSTTRLGYAEPFQCPISGILRLRILERENSISIRSEIEPFPSVEQLLMFGRSWHFHVISSNQL